MTAPGARPRRHPDAQCPLRYGEPCTLCQPGATGPQDCGLVYLIMDDEDARSAWVENRQQLRGSAKRSEGGRE